MINRSEQHALDRMVGRDGLRATLEGHRVEAVMRDASTMSGWKPRRFIVGRSTGWVPCHLAMRKGARGSSDVITRHTDINSVRKLD